MYFVLLYFMSVAFPKHISCVSRCARELLLLMYIVVSLVKTEVLSSFSAIIILLILLFYLIFSKNISANITYRILDNGHPSVVLSSLEKLATDVRLPWSVFLCFDKLFLFSVLFLVHIRNAIGLQRKISSPPCQVLFLSKRYHCCLNFIRVCVGHYIPIQLQVLNDSSSFYSCCLLGSCYIF